MIGVIIDLQGISRISFVCHVAVSQRKIETLVIWKLGEFSLQKTKTTGCYDWEPVFLKDPNMMLDGTKIVWSWVKCMNQINRLLE